MTDPIGMLEALSQWEEQINAFEEAATKEKITPRSYLGNYHEAVVRVLRGVKAIERARMEDIREMSESLRAMAEGNVQQARLELEKMEQARLKLEADVRLQDFKVQEAQLKVVQRLAEEVGEKVREASVIRARAYSRQQFTKTVVAGVVTVLLLLSVGYGLGRFSTMNAYADQTEQEN